MGGEGGKEKCWGSLKRKKKKRGKNALAKRRRNEMGGEKLKKRKELRLTH